MGLSGIGYGLFGLLYILSKRDPRFRDAMDARTARLFIGWFILCIVLTGTNVMPVANTAHAAGALLGVILGMLLTSDGAVRSVTATGLALLVCACVVCASSGRQYVNLSRDTSYELAYRGYAALKDGKDEDAVALLKKSVSLDDRSMEAWANLGIAYQRLQKMDEAADAYHHAVTLKPSNNELRRTYGQIIAYKGYQAQKVADWSNAATLYTEALIWYDDANIWYALAFCHEKQRRYADAEAALKQAVRADPGNASYQEALQRVQANSPP